MQQVSLKALARKALARNTPCNTHATTPPKVRNKQGEKTPSFVAQFSAIRDRLLTVARELGLPDKIVLDLPASELAATAEQVTWYADAEVRHKLLIFYLRSLAASESALPGSLAARDQARHTP